MVLKVWWLVGDRLKWKMLGMMAWLWMSSVWWVFIFLISWWFSSIGFREDWKVRENMLLIICFTRALKFCKVIVFLYWGWLVVLVVDGVSI